MKDLFKSILVWCMLLAVPLQGYAFATTLLCAPLGTASATVAALHAPAPAHDHRAMLLARHDADMHAAGAATSTHDCDESHDAGGNAKASSKHDASAQCDACSACCLGAAMVPSDAMRMPLASQQCTAIACDSGFALVVDLALPKRPPRACLT